MTDTEIIEIRARLQWHTDQLHESFRQMARLSMVAIALTVRREMPEAALVGLAWCDQDCDDHLTPEGYYTADRQRIVPPPSQEDGLNDEIYRYCTDLGEANRETWEPFATDDAGDGMILDGGEVRLKIDDVLAAHHEEGVTS